MIFAGETALSESERLREEISRRVIEVCGEAPDQLDEIARGVAAFIEAGESDCGGAAPWLLISQALRALGHASAARRLAVFGTATARPVDWHAAGQGGLVVNLEPLTRSARHRLELAFFPALAQLLDVVADAWDDSSGDGVLGLSGCRVAADRILGSGVNARKRRAFCDEVEASAEALLARHGRRRGWRATPRVLRAEL